MTAYRWRRLPLSAANLLALSLCLEFSTPGAFAQNAVSTGTKAGFRMYYPNSNDWWLDPSSGRFDIRANGGAPLLTLNNLGRLGIGTTNLLFPLQLRAGTDINLTVKPNAGALNLASLNDALSAFAPFRIEASNILLMPTGNVGIGTTNPLVALHVRGAFGTGAANGFYVENTSINRYFRAGWGSSYPRLIGDAGLGLAPADNNTDAVFISGSGFVGIGTASPTSLLTVNGSAEFDSAGSSVSVVAQRINFNRTNTFLSEALGWSTAGNPQWNLGVGLLDSSTEKFILTSAGTGYTNYLIADPAAQTVSFPTGNVGVGTTNPQAKLNVLNGNIQISTNTGASYGIIFQDGSVQTTAAVGQSLTLSSAEFTNSGTWPKPAGVTMVNVLLIGGGGGGGTGQGGVNGIGGGGGGSGFILYRQNFPVSGDVPVSIGAPAGGGVNGAPTAFGVLVATGGYAGASYNGGAGASGGGTGAGGCAGTYAGSGGSGTNGGSGYSPGGAGYGPYFLFNFGPGGRGGQGYTSPYSYCYGGSGGGGGGLAHQGVTASGGDGYDQYNGSPCSAGAAGTGAGGGGGYNGGSGGPGCAGGSGYVLITWLK